MGVGDYAVDSSALAAIVAGGGFATADIKSQAQAMVWLSGGASQLDALTAMLHDAFRQTFRLSA